MRALLLCACLSVSAAEPHMALRAVRVEAGVSITQHGMGIAVKTESGVRILTCAHLLTDQVTVELPEGWIRCRIESRDDELDIAWLIPAVEPKAAYDWATRDKDARPGTLTIHAPVAAEPIKRSRGKVSNHAGIIWRIDVEGYGSGSSGGAIVRNGALSGIVTASIPGRDALVYVPVRRIVRE